MKKTFAAVSLLLAALTPGACVAADPGFYLGLELGKGRTELQRENDDFVLTRGYVIDESADRLDDTVGIYGGYTISNHFGIEVAYSNLGESSYTTDRELPDGPFPGLPFPVPSAEAGWYNAGLNPRAVVLEQQRTTLDSEALSVALLGRLEIATELSLLAKVGIAVHRIETDLEFWLDGRPVRVIGGEDKESTGAGVLAIGSEWSFHPSWAVRLQAQRHFAFEEEEINLVDREDVTIVTGGIEYRF